MRYIGLLALGFALLAAPQKKDDAELWLQTATQAETVDGDLKSAIEQYKRIIGKPGAGREVVAKALVRLGLCYERQGNAEARKQYERAAREFGDQAKAAAEARDRLAAMNVAGPGKSSALTARRLWTGPAVGTTDEIALTADGRTLLFVDWDTGDAVTRDMNTGEIKRLGFKQSFAESPDYVLWPLFSRDQRQIAYTWFSAGAVKEDPTKSGYQLRLNSTERGAKPRVLLDHPEVLHARPFGWSADSKSILAMMWKKDRTGQIVSVPVAGGPFKTLKSLEWQFPGSPSLSPDGRYIAYDALDRKDSTDRHIFILAADGSSEVAAVRIPGRSQNPVWTPDGSHLVFSSDLVRHGGLYAIAVQDGKAQGAPKLLKAEVGPVELSRFVQSGALYYFQVTGAQNVYRADLDLTNGKVRSAPAPLGSEFTTNNGMSALSPDGKRVAYLATRASAQAPSYKGKSGGPGASSVIVKSLEGGDEKSFSTDVNLGWAPIWLPGGNALLLSGRRQPAKGQAIYRLDLESGRVTTLLENQVNFKQPGQMQGQRELSIDGETLYISVDAWGSPDVTEPDGGVITVSLSTGQVKRLHEVEGGAWGVSLSPDNRTLAAIAEGKLTLMGVDGSNPRKLYESGDLAHTAGLAWSSDGKAVLFVRAIPGSDWELWRMPVNGGGATFTGIRGPKLQQVHNGPNGAITYTAGVSRQAEVWAFDNLLPMLKASR